MQTKHIGLNMYDSRTRNLPCTPSYAIEFAALMLVYRLDEMRQQTLWDRSGRWIDIYLKQFYRSNTTQDAYPTKGESEMFMQTPEQRQGSIIAWEEAIKSAQQKTSAYVRHKVAVVKLQMRKTRLLKYTDKDVYDNTLRAIAADGKPQHELNLYAKYVSQIVYRRKKNESF